LEVPGILRSDGPSQLLVMDQPATVSRPSGQGEGEERQRRGDGDGGPPRTDQRDYCRDPGSARRNQETLRRLLVRTDGFLIDSFDFSHRVCTSASGEEDRDRAECGEDHDGERGAQERRTSQHRSRKQQPHREELAEYRSMINDEVKVDGVREREVAHG
jgi:hypothetical protein